MKALENSPVAVMVLALLVACDSNSATSGIDNGSVVVVAISVVVLPVVKTV